MWSNKKLIKSQTEKLLSDTFGYYVRLSNARTIESRSHIHRFDVIDGPQDLAKHIIVKQTRDMQNHTLEASGYPSQSWLFFNDWAGLQFLQQVVPDNSLSPHFYAGDRQQGILISEDVSPSRMLSLFLQEHNPLASELIKGCPTAADDTLFYHAVVEACAYWVLLLCQFNAISQFSKKEAKQDSVLMHERVIMRFEHFAQATQEFGHLEALGATFQLLATRLHNLWFAKGNSTLPMFPAFSTVLKQ